MPRSLALRREITLSNTLKTFLHLTFPEHLVCNTDSFLCFLSISSPSSSSVTVLHATSLREVAVLQFAGVVECMACCGGNEALLTAQGLTTHHSDTLAVLEASGCMRFYALSQQAAEERGHIRIGDADNHHQPLYSSIGLQIRHEQLHVFVATTQDHLIVVQPFPLSPQHADNFIPSHTLHVDYPSSSPPFFFSHLDPPASIACYANNGQVFVLKERNNGDDGNDNNYDENGNNDTNSGILNSNKSSTNGSGVGNIGEWLVVNDLRMVGGSLSPFKPRGHQDGVVVVVQQQQLMFVWRCQLLRLWSHEEAAVQLVDAAVVSSNLLLLFVHSQGEKRVEQRDLSTMRLCSTYSLHQTTPLQTLLHPSHDNNKRHNDQTVTYITLNVLDDSSVKMSLFSFAAPDITLATTHHDHQLLQDLIAQGHVTEPLLSLVPHVRLRCGDVEALLQMCVRDGGGRLLGLLKKRLSEGCRGEKGGLSGEECSLLMGRVHRLERQVATEMLLDSSLAKSSQQVLLKIRDIAAKTGMVVPLNFLGDDDVKFKMLETTLDMMGAEDSFEGRFDWLGVVNREDLLTSYLLHMSDGRASNQNVERVVKAISLMEEEESRLRGVLSVLKWCSRPPASLQALLNPLLTHKSLLGTELRGRMRGLWMEEHVVAEEAGVWDRKRELRRRLKGGCCISSEDFSLLLRMARYTGVGVEGVLVDWLDGKVRSDADLRGVVQQMRQINQMFHSQALADPLDDLTPKEPASIGGALKKFVELAYLNATFPATSSHLSRKYAQAVVHFVEAYMCCHGDGCYGCCSDDDDDDDACYDSSDWLCQGGVVELREEEEEEEEDGGGHCNIYYVSLVAELKSVLRRDEEEEEEEDEDMFERDVDRAFTEVHQRWMHSLRGGGFECTAAEVHKLNRRLPLLQPPCLKQALLRQQVFSIACDLHHASHHSPSSRHELPLEWSSVLPLLTPLVSALYTTSLKDELINTDLPAFKRLLLSHWTPLQELLESHNQHRLLLSVLCSINNTLLLFSQQQQPTKPSLTPAPTNLSSDPTTPASNEPLKASHNHAFSPHLLLPSSTDLVSSFVQSVLNHPSPNHPFSSHPSSSHLRAIHSALSSLLTSVRAVVLLTSLFQANHMQALLQHNIAATLLIYSRLQHLESKHLMHLCTTSHWKHFLASHHIPLDLLFPHTSTLRALATHPSIHHSTLSAFMHHFDLPSSSLFHVLDDLIGKPPLRHRLQVLCGLLQRHDLLHFLHKHLHTSTHLPTLSQLLTLLTPLDDTSKHRRLFKLLLHCQHQHSHNNCLTFQQLSTPQVISSSTTSLSLSTLPSWVAVHAELGVDVDDLILTCIYNHSHRGAACTDDVRRLATHIRDPSKAVKLLDWLYRSVHTTSALADSLLRQAVQCCLAWNSPLGATALVHYEAELKRCQVSRLLLQRGFHAIHTSLAHLLHPSSSSSSSSSSSNHSDASGPMGMDEVMSVVRSLYAHECLLLGDSVVHETVEEIFSILSIPSQQVYDVLLREWLEDCAGSPGLLNNQQTDSHKGLQHNNQQNNTQQQQQQSSNSVHKVNYLLTRVPVEDAQQLLLTFVATTIDGPSSHPPSNPTPLLLKLTPSSACSTVVFAVRCLCRLLTPAELLLLLNVPDMQSLLAFLLDVEMVVMLHKRPGQLAAFRRLNKVSLLKAIVCEVESGVMDGGRLDDGGRAVESVACLLQSYCGREREVVRRVFHLLFSTHDFQAAPALLTHLSWPAEDDSYFSHVATKLFSAAIQHVRELACTEETDLLLVRCFNALLCCVVGGVVGDVEEVVQWMDALKNMQSLPLWLCLALLWRRQTRWCGRGGGRLGALVDEALSAQVARQVASRLSASSVMHSCLMFDVLLAHVSKSTNLAIAPLRESDEGVADTSMLVLHQTAQLAQSMLDITCADLSINDCSFASHSILSH